MNRLLFKGGLLDSRTLPVENQLPIASTFKIPTGVGGFLEYRVTEDWEAGSQVAVFVSEFSPEQLLREEFAKIEAEHKARRDKAEKLHRIVLFLVGGSFTAFVLAMTVIVIVKAFK